MLKKRLSAKLVRGGQSQLREAEIEVDKETKAVRRLVMKRDIPKRGTSTVTFTLVDAGSPDASKYQPEGHLTEARQIFTRTTHSEKRREVLKSWFGSTAENWIKTEELNKSAN